MAQQVLENLESRLSFRNKLNANFTELYGAGTLPATWPWAALSGVPAWLLGAPIVVPPAVVPATAVLTVAAVSYNYAEVALAVPAVTLTSIITAHLVPELDAENDVEELADSNMRVFAIPEAGQIRFVLTGNGAFVGDFKVFYEVTNP